MSILFFYTLLIITCAYGASQLKTLFSFDLFLTPGFTSYEYTMAKYDHFRVGWNPITFVEIMEEDFYTEEP